MSIIAAKGLKVNGILQISCFLFNVHNVFQVICKEQEKNSFKQQQVDLRSNADAQLQAAGPDALADQQLHAADVMQA